MRSMGTYKDGQASRAQAFHTGVSGVLILAVSLLVANASLATASSDEPWSKYIHSPASRNVSPVGVHSIEGNASVRNCSSGRQVIRLEAGSRISLDFGVEVGGHVSFNARSASSSPLSLAYAESPSFVREISDDTGATPGMDWDQAYNVTLDDGHAERADVVVFNVTCEIGFAPNMPDLRSGTGYFYAGDDDLLNRIWYAGAYTIQTNIAPADTGRWLPQRRLPALVDGAKRDRAIWPGDLGIQGPIAMMAYGEPGRESVRNSLATLFHYQNATTGMFPFAGPATGSFRSGARSDTYHSWALISMYDYAVWSGDEAWVAEHWGNITRGVEYITTRLDPGTGLQEQAEHGGFNSALNALNYHALNSLATLAQSGDQKQSWEEAAARIKKGYNDLLWDKEAGLYRDNPSSTLHAQDGNSLALLYGLAENGTQRTTVSRGLERNWNDIGPVTPELEDTISPFISGLELLAHLHGAGDTERAQRLLRRLWGYLLDDGDGNGLFTGSTFAEGLAANGSLYYRSERSYKYDAAYTSLAHGWSSGPTTALVTGVLGLRLEEIGGRRWSLRPQLGEELRSVRAGFETGLGWFEGKVTVGEDGDVEVEVVAPKGTKGRIVFPDEARGRVRVNGREFRGQLEETALVMDLEM
uniref:Alpha-L-rhamnosidase six-hairpin glycosidase domain-containing protein n=1 Tax=Bionectria ochroleuca TaxID=29856 RepID=A0A8H7TTS2_BIOOC